MNILEKKITISDDCLVQKMGEGLVLMNLGTEYFYELDETGKRFWELLSEHQEIGTAFNLLQEEYEVSPELLEKDLAALIDGLVKAHLITVY